MTLSYAGFHQDSGHAIAAEGQWSQLHRRVGKLQSDEGILRGGDLSPVAGARRLSVAAFNGILPGILVDNDGAIQTPLHDPVSSGKRIDYLTLTADWTSHSVYFEVVKGASGTTFPSLGAQTIGGLYRMPYARVTVRAGASAFDLANDVEVCKPIPCKPNRYASTVNPVTSGGSVTDWTPLAGVTIPDPGWPYLLGISSQVRFGMTGSGGGYFRLRALDVSASRTVVDGTGDRALAEGITPYLQADRGTKAAAVLNRTTEKLTGSRQVRLEMTPVELSGGEVRQVLDHPVNHFTVLQIPT